MEEGAALFVSMEEEFEMREVLGMELGMAVSDPGVRGPSDAKVRNSHAHIA